MTTPIGFIGLGVMGRPMATNLASRHPLVVWNRSPDAAADLAAHGATVAKTPHEVLERCEVVILMLAHTAAITGVLEGADVAGTTIVQMGTIAPADSLALRDRIESAGGRYVEAPVSGSRQPAIDGTLVAMLAGDPADLDVVEPLMAPMCAQVFRCGPVPGGLAMKLAVNTFLVTMVAGLAEAFHFAETHGLDAALLRDVLEAGPMASAVSRIKADKLVAGDWSVQAAIPDVLKNARLVADEARAVGAASPLVDVSAELYAHALELGHAHADMVAIIAAMRALDSPHP